MNGTVRKTLKVALVGLFVAMMGAVITASVSNTYARYCSIDENKRIATANREAIAKIEKTRERDRDEVRQEIKELRGDMRDANKKLDRLLMMDGARRGRER